MTSKKQKYYLLILNFFCTLNGKILVVHSLNLCAIFKDIKVFVRGHLVIESSFSFLYFIVTKKMTA